MKLKVMKEDLLSALQRVHPAVPTRTTLPVLSNLLLEVTGQSLCVTASDLAMTVRASMPATVEEEGATTLEARRLIPIVRELAGPEIEIQTEPAEVTVLTSGAAVFRLKGVSAEDFPVLPKLSEANKYVIDKRLFRGMLQKTVYAASKDESREVLNGILVEIGSDRLTVVGTDGRRLAMVEQEADGLGPDAAVIIPTRAVTEMIEILDGDGNATLSVMGKQAALDSGNVILFTSLVEGKFPNYRLVIPQQANLRVVLPREAFLNALRRVSLLTNQSTHSIKVRFLKDTVQISAETPEVGEAMEELEVKYVGKEMLIPFNPEFLMEPLKTLVCDEVFFDMNDEISPALMKTNEPFLYVIMPLRLP